MVAKMVNIIIKKNDIISLNVKIKIVFKPKILFCLHDIRFNFENII